MEKENIMKEKLKHWLKEAAQFLLNPHLLICLGIGWMITNGWSYFLFALGTWMNIPWMIAVSGTYIAFLWFPCTPEKVITVIIAMVLLRRLYPDDEKTLKKLRELRARYKLQRKEWKKQRESVKKQALPENAGEKSNADRQRL